MDNTNNNDEFLFRDIEADYNGDSMNEDINDVAEDASDAEYNTDETTDGGQFYYSQEEAEKDYYENDDYTTRVEENVGNNQIEKTNLGIISFALYFVSGAIAGLASYTNKGAVIEGIAAMVGLASFVLMIYTRVKFPKDVWGKVTMWLYIVSVGMTIIAAILLLVACFTCASGLKGF